MPVRALESSTESLLGNSEPGTAPGLGEEEEERAAGSGCWGDQRRGEKKGGQERGKEGNGKKNVQTMFGQGAMFVQDHVPKIPPVPSTAGGAAAPARLQRGSAGLCSGWAQGTQHRAQGTAAEPGTLAGLCQSWGHSLGCAGAGDTRWAVL